MKSPPNTSNRICKLVTVASLILAIIGVFQLRIIHKEFGILFRYRTLIEKQNTAIENSTKTLHAAGNTYVDLINLHKQDQIKIELLNEKLKRAYDGIERLQCRLQYARDGHLHLCDIDSAGEPE